MSNRPPNLEDRSFLKTFQYERTFSENDISKGLLIWITVCSTDIPMRGAFSGLTETFDHEYVTKQVLFANTRKV